MGNTKIILRGKKLEPNEQGCIKLEKDAMVLLVDLANETGMPLRRLASEIIRQTINGGLVEIERC